MRIAVIGAGVVGMAVTGVLVARAFDVTCYERSAVLMGERSAGSSRIFRLAHRTESLVRLAQRAWAGYALWEQRAGARMIGGQGCALSVADWQMWASAMAAADVPVDVVDGPSARLRVPAVKPPQVALVDRAGGVIDANAVRAHLTAVAGPVVVREPVYAIENRRSVVSVFSRAGRGEFDAVLIAAGAGTAPLAEQVGICLPSALAHHIRFTFPIADDVDWQCWIDKPAEGLSTYQHQTGPGRWAVGGSVDPTLVAWEAGRDSATDASRAVITQYVRRRLVAVPTVVDSLYCTTVPNLGDGVSVHRGGSVLAVSGENLFKLAPVLGDALADACLTGATPSVEEIAAR
jgi:sarcosine oxidase